MGTAEVIRTYWESAEGREWERFAATLHEDVVYDSPQSRERVRGREAYVRFNQEGFTDDWHITLERLVAADRQPATWIVVRRGDGTVQDGLCFFDLDHSGRVTMVTDFWPEPYEVPPSRSHLVERY
jgi:hypothetical protein